MRILLMGDGSGCHSHLAEGLRAAGHQVCLASDGCYWMHTDRDISLSRPSEGKLGGLRLWMRVKRLTARQLRGFDIVQIFSPWFMHLKPQRLLAVARELKRHNGPLVLNTVATDSLLVQNLTGQNPALPYSEWTSPWGRAHAPEMLQPHLLDYCNAIYDLADGCVTALYEYERLMQEIRPDLPRAYTGIPVKTSLEPIRPAGAKNNEINILFASHIIREAEKGADRLLPMFRQLEYEMKGAVKLLTPRNVPLAEFNAMLQNADIVSDQLYSLTPATTALMTMAQGGVPVSGADPLFYDFISEHSLRPIINANQADLDDTFTTLKDLITQREKLTEMGKQGPEFVKKHNSEGVVAARTIAFYNRLLQA